MSKRKVGPHTPQLEQLQEFVGGEIIFSRPFAGVTYYGPISDITAEGSNFIVEMDWCAQDIGHGNQHHWLAAPIKYHKIKRKGFVGVPLSNHRFYLAARIPHVEIYLHTASHGYNISRNEVVDKVILFMDDLRTAPPGALVARNISDIIELFTRITMSVKIDELWLDHDLGGDSTIMPLITMLEEAATHNKRYNIGTVYVHSDNSSARETMLRSLRRYGYNCRIATFRATKEK